MDDLEEKVQKLENEVEELKSVIAALAAITPLDLSDDVSIKIDEVLSKFKLK